MAQFEMIKYYKITDNGKFKVEKTDKEMPTENPPIWHEQGDIYNYQLALKYWHSSFVDAGEVHPEHREKFRSLVWNEWKKQNENWIKLTPKDFEQALSQGITIPAKEFEGLVAVEPRCVHGCKGVCSKGECEADLYLVLKGHTENNRIGDEGAMLRYLDKNNNAIVKIFTIGYLRELDQQVTAGDISYSRMVELLNEKANQYFVDPKDIQQARDLADARLIVINDLLNTLEEKLKEKEGLLAKISDLEAEVGGGKLYEYQLEAEINDLKKQLAEKNK